MSAHLLRPLLLPSCPRSVDRFGHKARVLGEQQSEATNWRQNHFKHSISANSPGSWTLWAPEVGIRKWPFFACTQAGMGNLGVWYIIRWDGARVKVGRYPACFYCNFHQKPKLTSSDEVIDRISSVWARGFALNELAVSSRLLPTVATTHLAIGPSAAMVFGTALVVIERDRPLFDEPGQKCTGGCPGVIPRSRCTLLIFFVAPTTGHELFFVFRLFRAAQNSTRFPAMSCHLGVFYLPLD